MRSWKYPNLWDGCVGAYCPSMDNSRSNRLSDLSGRNNHGTLTSMDPGTDFVASEHGMALDFDATNDYVLLDRLATPVNNLTLSCWFKVNDVTAYRTLINFSASANNSHYIILQTRGDVAGDPLEIIVAAGGGAATARTLGITTGKWLHACATMSASEIVVYLSGVGTTTASALSPTVNRTTIGAFFGTVGDGFMNGQIDDVRIYNRVLTLPGIQQLGTRRRIAYDRLRHRVAKRATANNYSGNNMLMGCAG